MSNHELAAVDACPLCGSPRSRSHSQPAANRYSEALAVLTGIAEADLLDRVANVSCLDCSLVYKRRWFSPEVLRALFREAVPDHPRGWDVVSDRFSADSFAAEVAAYQEALAERETEQIHRYRRALTSIVDAIPELVGSSESLKLRAAIQAADIAVLQESVPWLRTVIRSPAPYGRFSGFSSESLWEYLQAKLGSIAAYAEVGCPLWGLLRRARQGGARACYLQRAEPNYWAEGCRREGVHCAEYLVAATGVEAAAWDAVRRERFDLIGAFQYLDHLTAPGQFLDELFARGDAAALILDAIDMPVAIQHLTGWTSDAMHWLAERHRCRLEADFTEIRASGSQLFLLVPAV